MALSGTRGKLGEMLRRHDVTTQDQVFINREFDKALNFANQPSQQVEKGRDEFGEALLAIAGDRISGRSLTILCLKLALALLGL